LPTLIPLQFPGTSILLFAQHGFLSSWWFFHLPPTRAVTAGKLNNWWSYIYDFNRFDWSSIAYSSKQTIPRPLLSFPGEQAIRARICRTAEGWGYCVPCRTSDLWPSGRLSQYSHPVLSTRARFSLQVLIDQESFHYHGRNDTFLPDLPNALWEPDQPVPGRIRSKLGLNPGFIAGANPIIRLCANGGNRISKFAPPQERPLRGTSFLEPIFKGKRLVHLLPPQSTATTNWEVNVIGYIDPTLIPCKYADASAAT